jgi:hypothetical protein
MKASEIECETVRGHVQRWHLKPSTARLKPPFTLGGTTGKNIDELGQASVGVLELRSSRLGSLNELNVSSGVERGSAGDQAHGEALCFETAKWE